MNYLFMTTRHFASLAIIPFLIASIQAQTPKEAATTTAVTKATAAAEAVLKKLPSIPGAADAKVINIHIGDIFTFGFDEGIDAEEWGMVDNQNESGQAATPGQPKATVTPAPHEKPSTYRKIDFRKGDVVLIATEQPVDAPKPAASPVSTPAEPATTSASPTPTPHAPAPHTTEKPATPSVP